MSRPQHPTGTLPIAKLPAARRYTSEARESMNCKSCRKRKIKCSRTRPSCNACDVFHCECVYVPKKRGPKTEVLEELLKRIDGLERRLGENESGSGSGNRDSPPDHGLSSKRKLDEMSSPSGLSPPPPPPPAVTLVVPALPTPATAEERLVPRLVKVFFERVNGKPYTLFHEGIFRQKWAEGRVSGYILDTICAVSVRYAPVHDLGTKLAQEYSEEFAARARSQVDSDEPTLENLQSLLLLSMTYYAMGYGKKSFMQMGSAIRMTLALDLHRELPACHSASPLEREVRRRVFWACYLIDRFTVCGSVRPPCFSDRSIYLRLPCTEDSFQRGIPSDSPHFSEAGTGFSIGGQISNSNLLIDVVRILGRTIRYTQSGGVKGDSHFPWHTASNLSRIRSELNAWASTRDLREGVPPTPDATSLFLARTVWHVIHCLMYRNFLPIDLAELDGNGTQQAWQMEATKVCFQHANALVDLISIAAMTPSIEWPAFAGFCLATAASVLVHGVFYKGSDAFRRCRENLVTVLAQLRVLMDIWACMRQHLFLLKKLYLCHERLVDSYSADKRPASVFHLDDFFDRYNNGASGGHGFESSHVPFFDVKGEDVDTSFIGTFDPSPPIPLPPMQQMTRQQHHQPQQQQYIEEYPFSPTTPQDLQFLSVPSLGYDYDDYSQQPQFLAQGGEEEERQRRQKQQQHQQHQQHQHQHQQQHQQHQQGEQDPLLSMLAEMAERDVLANTGGGGGGGGGGAAGVGSGPGDMWMGGTGVSGPTS